MRRTATLFCWIVVAAALLAGCSSVDDKPIVVVTDNEGVVEPRTVTVGYANERLEKMPGPLLPAVGGDEGKREFLQEIIRKEMIVLHGYRTGIDKDERIANIMPMFEDGKAEEMLREDVVVKPSEITQAELEDYYAIRDMLFQVQEIVVADEEAAREAYRRVTEGEEDFGRVAKEVSTAQSADAGGERAVMPWLDMHPLIRVALEGAKKGDIVGPVEVAGSWQVLKVVSAKMPADRKPLEGQNLTNMKVEARGFKRNMIEHEVIDRWMAEANLTYDDAGLDIALQRVTERVAEVVPPPQKGLSNEELIARAQIAVVPQFTPEEAEMEFARFTIGGEERVWTLGDYARELGKVDGTETPKSGEPLYVKDFVKKFVFRAVKDHEIEVRGYRTSKEMAEHLAMRLEEAVLDLTYEAEVSNKVVEPTGQEVREYFRSHREDYAMAASADVRQIMVGTEAEANQLLQQLREGTATFEDLVQSRSIESWSKAKDGLITKLYQGEGRLDYLQEPAFSLEIGELSEPIRAPGGYVIVRVEARYPRELMTFDEVGSNVVALLSSQRREARLEEFLDELSETVTSEIVEENIQYLKDPLEIAESKRVTRSSNLGG